jgi:hypothetical protein
MERLTQLEARFAREGAKAEKEGVDARQQLDRLRAEVSRVKKAWLRRSQKVRGLGTSFAQTAGKAVSSTWDQARNRRAEEVVKAVLQGVRQQYQQLEDLRDKIPGIAAELRQGGAPKTRIDPFTVRMPCPTPKSADQVNPEARDFFEWLSDGGRKLHDLLDLRKEELVKVFLAFAHTRKSVLALQEMEMSSAWEACPEEDKLEYIRLLEELASPLWEYEPEFLGGDKSTSMLQIMGVPNARFNLEDVLPRSSQAGRSVHRATTGDGRRIYCYKVEAAIPAFILSGIRNYRPRFARTSSETFFHIDLRWENIPDLCPDGYPNLGARPSSNGTGPHRASGSDPPREEGVPGTLRIDTTVIPMASGPETNGHGGPTEPPAASSAPESADETSDGVTP